MVKRKFKDIEKNDGKKESPPLRSKRQKKEEHEDSGRTVTLTKKRMASRYNKASVGKIVSIKMLVKRRGSYDITVILKNRINVYRAKDLKWGWNNLS